MLKISIEPDDSGMIFATSEGPDGIFVAVKTWDELWIALRHAVELWQAGAEQ